MVHLRSVVALGLLSTANSCRTNEDRDAIVADLRRLFINGRSESEQKRQDYVAGSLRLAFHDAGTFDISSKDGGPSGCIVDESIDPDNSGLQRVIDLLEPVFQSHVDRCPSRGDFWALAAAAAVDDAMISTNPDVSLVAQFEWGRDFESDCSAKRGRLPSHQLGLDHVRDVFTKRMGFSDDEIVALMGAHTIGRGHVQHSGFDMAWDSTMMTFDNQYYQEILNGEWARARVKANDLHNWVDPRFANTLTGNRNMMLNTDMALAFDYGTHDTGTEKTMENSCQINWDEALKVLINPNAPWEAIAPDGSGMCPDLNGNVNPRRTIELYASNQRRFQRDFGAAFRKLMGLGYEAEKGSLCDVCVSRENCCCRGKCVVSSPNPSPSPSPAVNPAPPSSDEPSPSPAVNPAPPSLDEPSPAVNPAPPSSDEPSPAVNPTPPSSDEASDPKPAPAPKGKHKECRKKRKKMRKRRRRYRRRNGDK